MGRGGEEGYAEVAEGARGRRGGWGEGRGKEEGEKS